MTTAQTSSPPNLADALTLADRCDRCGAQAFVYAMSSQQDHELLFCNHHGVEFGIGLTVQGFSLFTKTIQARVNDTDH